MCGFPQKHVSFSFYLENVTGTVHCKLVRVRSAFVLQRLLRYIGSWHASWKSILHLGLSLCKTTLSGGDQGDVQATNAWGKLIDHCRALGGKGRLYGGFLGGTIGT